MNRLKHRRHWYLSTERPKKLPQIDQWQYLSIGPYHVYAAADLAATKATIESDELVVLGFALDPLNVHETDAGIARRVLERLRTGAALDEATGVFGGRWVMIVNLGGEIQILNDTCGLRPVYYTTSSYSRGNAGVACAADPILLDEELGLSRDPHVDEFIAGQKHHDREHWLPCGWSEYADVLRLQPNHVLRLGPQSVSRFWPVRQCPSAPVDDAFATYTELLKGLMDAAAARFPLSVPMTAGLDSRTLLALTRDLGESVVGYYTLSFQGLSDLQDDLWVPQKLFPKLGLTHDILQCPEQVSEEFWNTYQQHSSLAHEGYAPLAYAILESKYADTMAVKGHCAEICQVYMAGSRDPERKIAVGDMCHRAHLHETDRLLDDLERWLNEMATIYDDFGYEPLDLYYWEQRAAGWLAQGTTELDLVQESFHPFNCRALLESGLSAPRPLRQLPNFPFFYRVLEHFWPETLQVPVNPHLASLRVRALRFLRRTFTKR